MKETSLPADFGGVRRRARALSLARTVWAEGHRASRENVARQDTKPFAQRRVGVRARRTAFEGRPPAW
jgi:hypothetical protein